MNKKFNPQITNILIHITISENFKLSQANSYKLTVKAISLISLL